MKKLISLLLAMVMLTSTLALPAFAQEMNNNESVTTNVDPRLDYYTTIQLGSAWTDIWTENNLIYANLTVKNMTTSSDDVLIRIISIDREDILKEAKTISPGHSATFFLSSGGYIIQGKSVDNEAHTYELRCFDQFA